MIRQSLAVLMALSAGIHAADTEGGDVEGIFGYGDITVHAYTAQDLENAVNDKNNITVLLYNSIVVTDETPHFVGFFNDAPCWGEECLFNLSNFVFKPSSEQNYCALSFVPAEGTNVGKVVRNGRAEFQSLENVNFSGIHNIKEDMESSFSPFQPVSLKTLESAGLTSSDTLACYGYGGVFSSASGLVDGDGGGVRFDGNGAVLFENINYDGSKMGDVDCGICLYGGAIYSESEYTVEICRTGGNDFGSGDVRFQDVRITLDRSAYANSSSAYFYAYGGAIMAHNVSIDENRGQVAFYSVGITQKAVNYDEGYGMGGALYLSGNNNSISNNVGEVSFSYGGISVANQAQGGAIYLTSEATLHIDGNEKDVSFHDNLVKASAIDGMTYDDATAQGGAIYLSAKSSLSICDNKDCVSFTSNMASATVSQSDAVAKSAGGAIWGAAGSHIEISGNVEVYFTHNVASQGSAIYTEGSLSIRNNQYVEISDNKGEYAVYMKGNEAVLHLSAAGQASIHIEDDMYVEGAARFNDDYNGVEQAGTIDLQGNSVKVGGGITLNNGTLRLMQGSNLDASLSLTSSATLAAEGAGNTIAGAVHLVEGSTLALTLNSDTNQETAVLSLGDVLSAEGPFNLVVTLGGTFASETDYVLLQLEDYPYSENAWNEERVHVTGDVSFADLVWVENYTKLVYRAPLVPEPATCTLALLALAGVCARRRRRG